MPYKLAESFPLPIILVFGGVVISVSNEFLVKFGYSRGAIMGKSPLAFINPDEDELISEVVDGEHDLPVRSTVVHKNGSLITVEIEGRSLYSESHRSRIISLKDITGVRKLEDDLQKALEHSKQFSHIVAHDLKGPIRAIVGYSELLYEKLYTLGVSDKQAIQYLQDISTSCERMTSLIHDLLKLTEVDSGILNECVDLNETVEIARKSVEQYLDESGAFISIPSDMPTVRGSNSMLADLFHNLFSNSLKYRDQHRILRIEVTWQRHKNVYIFRVIDNGIGFDPNHREFVFKMFKRLHTDGFPGTGVGLAICQRIVERHGGAIWADSEPGVGSTFSFTLPVP